MRASDSYVRIIIRRPHAYFFVADLFKDKAGQSLEKLRGSLLPDGSSPPIPGIYIIEDDGSYLASSRLTAKGLRELVGLQE